MQPPSPLTITGQRLNGPGHFTADIPPVEAYGPTGFIPSGLEFSRGGCWRVTARLADSRVVLYVRTDDSKAPICRQLACQLANLDLLDNPADDRLEQPIRAEQHDWGCAT